MEAEIIRVKRRRIRRREDRTEELATMTEVFAEEDEPEDSTRTTDASVEEAEETTCPIEHIRRRCV